MTEPSQYFKGRTVQEQMNEVIGYVDVRSAEVATDAIAADVAQVHQDMLDADADASAAAASAAAAAGTLANAVKKTGESSQSIAGDIIISGAASVGSLGVGAHAALVDATVSGHISVPAPTANGYAANKKYVDDADALKADKTYVDAQDALKINIADINSYAVGLTGNQTVAGIKTFTSYIEGVTVGTRVRGQFVQDKWYDLGKINESGRYLVEAKIAFTSGTFDTYSVMNVTLGPAIKVRRLGTLTTSNWAGSGIATAKNSSNETHLLLKGYDNRWITEVQVLENFRQGNPCNFIPTESPAPQDDLSAYTGIVYGDDVS